MVVRIRRRKRPPISVFLKMELGAPVKYRQMQPESIGLYVGRNTQGHDEARYGEAPEGPGEKYVQKESRRTGEMGQGNEAEVDRGAK
jgi:hypothetical protein